MLVYTAGSGVLEVPSWFGGAVKWFTIGNTGSWESQLAFDAYSNEVAVRARQSSAGAFRPWARLWNSDNQLALGTAATARAAIGAQVAGSYAPATHTHTWAQVTGAPATATRWPTFAEVTGKPTTFTPPVPTATVRGGFKMTFVSGTLNLITT